MLPKVHTMGNRGGVRGTDLESCDAVQHTDSPECDTTLEHSREGEIYMEASVLIAAAVLLNVIGFLAWKRGELGQWYRAAVGVATLALLFGGGWVRTVGIGVALLLGLYAVVAWARHRKGLQPGIHRLRSRRI